MSGEDKEEKSTFRWDYNREKRRRCEWGKDDYSLPVENLPKAPPPKGQMELIPSDGDDSRMTTSSSSVKMAAKEKVHE